MADPAPPNRTDAPADTDASASRARAATIPAPFGGLGGLVFGPPVAAGEVGTVGPYRLLKQLGKGGMGAVYLALDTRLNRKLALKVILPEFAADAGARERFLREARAAAQVSHDNVVTVFEADERDGVPYIAMQFLQGYPLDEYLKTKGTPALAHVVRIAREAALGLAAAHELGLVHRDVKPANLWLEVPNGRVKVLDFGLARPVASESELTASGAVMGTPAYMAPEQARGLKVDHRADLWSLGAVLYRLCTGRNPFTGATAMAVVMSLGTEEPTPVRELSPQTPEPLAELVHQLLAKRPEQRPPTAVEVARRLQAILAHVLNPPASGPQPVVVQQRPMVVAMQVTAVPESVFAGLGDDPEDVATEVETAPPRAPKAGGKALLYAAAGAVLLAVVAVVAVVVSLAGGKKPVVEGPSPESPQPVPIDKKPEPVVWAPGPVWAPTPAGASPLDKLDAGAIPADERFDWQPKGLVAVIGSHARRHWGPVFSAAFSPDGKSAATVGGGGSGSALIVWDAATGTPRRTLRPRDGHYYGCAVDFAPDGRLFFYSPSGWLTVYDLSGPDATSAEYNLPDKLGDTVRGGNGAVWLCEGGRTLVVSSWFGHLGLFDVSAGPPRLVTAVPAAHGALVAPAADRLFYTAPDGKARRATIKGAALVDGAELRVVLGKDDAPRAVSADGKRLLTRDGAEYQVWHLDRDPPVRGLAFPPVPDSVSPDGLGTFTFSADGRWLTSKYTSTGLYLIAGDKVLGRRIDEGDHDSTGAVAFAPDGGRAVAGNHMGLVRFWALSGATVTEVAPFDPATAFADFTPPARNGLILPRLDRVNGFFQHQAWDLTGPKPVPAAVSNPETERPARFEFLAAGRALEHGSGGAFRLYEPAGGRWKAVGEPFGGANLSLVAGPLAVGLIQRDGGARVEGWNLAAAPPKLAWGGDLPTFEAGFESLFFVSADGRVLATPRRAKDKSLELVLWRLTGPKPVEYAAIPVTAPVHVYRGCLSADGGKLAHYDANAGGSALFVFDLNGSAAREARALPVVNVSTMAFHPDGKKLAVTRHAGGGAGVLDADTGRELWSWVGPGAVRRAAFAHDGRHLLLSNANNTVYVVRLANLDGKPGADPDRAAVEWALSVGGLVSIKDAAGERAVKATGDLPQGPFTVAALNFHHLGGAVTDADLARLSGLTRLRSLGLNGTKVTDAGLAHLAGLTGLEWVILSNTAVDGTGFRHLAGLTALRILSAGATPLGDAGLEHLARLEWLAQLDAEGTKVTADGVAKLQKALPKCKIGWDGPKKKP